MNIKLSDKAKEKIKGMNQQIQAIDAQLQSYIFGIVDGSTYKTTEKTEIRMSEDGSELILSEPEETKAKK